MPLTRPAWLTLSALEVAGGDHRQGLHGHVQGVSALHKHHVLAGRALQEDLVGDFLRQGAEQPRPATLRWDAGSGRAGVCGPWDPGRRSPPDNPPPGVEPQARSGPPQWGGAGGGARPHLLEEHHLQPVGEVQALVVWAERHGEVLRHARVHDALHRDHAEHALAAVVLRACGRGEAVPAPAPPRPSAAAPRPAPLAFPTLSSSPPPGRCGPETPPPCSPAHPAPPPSRLTHDFCPLGGRGGEELRQLLLVLAPGAGEAVQPHGELDGQRGVVLQLRRPGDRQPPASAPCPRGQPAASSAPDAGVGAAHAPSRPAPQPELPILQEAARRGLCLPEQSLKTRQPSAEPTTSSPTFFPALRLLLLRAPLLRKTPPSALVCIQTPTSARLGGRCPVEGWTPGACAAQKQGGAAGKACLLAREW